MRHNYQKLIKESAAELKELEKKHRNTVISSRIRFVRLLKSGKASSVEAAARIIHYSRGHCQRWLKSYQERGIVALLEPLKKPPGQSERMTPKAWEVLNDALDKGELGTYAQARELLAGVGVVYKDDTSILKLFKRHGIKAKTGRPVHEKADPDAQAAFKKTLLRL